MAQFPNFTQLGLIFFKIISSPYGTPIKKLEILIINSINYDARLYFVQFYKKHLACDVPELI